MLEASSALTVNVNGAPAVADAGALTAKCVVAPAVTATALEVPVTDEVTVSVPVMDWLPDVLNVTGNVPTPLASVEFAGSTACASLEVKCTMPEYVPAVLLYASRAVTVTLEGVPAVAVAAVESVKRAAGPGATETEFDVAASAGVTVSVALTVWFPEVLNVSGNVPVPPTIVAFPGNTAAPSLEAKCTMPEYPIATLLSTSSAVTVTEVTRPATVPAGELTERCVAGPAVTPMGTEDPVTEESTVSVAEIVCEP